MKMLMCLGVALVCLCTHGATDKVKKTVKDDAVKTAKIEKLDKTKALSPMMQANIKEYNELKKNLGVDDPELTRTDSLELIVLAYAKLFDNLETRVSNLELRTRTLENAVNSLNAETTALKQKTDEIDADLSKLYGWSNKIDDELHNELILNGVANKIKKLRDDVSADLGEHSRAINNQAQLIRSAQNGVNNNGAAIRDLYSIINSIR